MVWHAYLDVQNIIWLAKGSKNSQHANQKAKAAAQQKYEKAKDEYEAMKSKPNKTPEDKKQLDKLKKSMDRERQKAEFGGENHSRNAKEIDNEKIYIYS